MTETITTTRAANAHERAGDAVFNAAGGGSLALLCNTLRLDECLTIVVTRRKALWEVTVTLPDSTKREAAANTVHNALWEAMT